MLLSQHDMTFVPWKPIKGQALANFLAGHPIPEISKLHEDILNEVIKDNMILGDDVW